MASYEAKEYQCEKLGGELIEVSARGSVETEEGLEPRRTELVCAVDPEDTMETIDELSQYVYQVGYNDAHKSKMTPEAMKRKDTFRGASGVEELVNRFFGE